MQQNLKLLKEPRVYIYILFILFPLFTNFKSISYDFNINPTILKLSISLFFSSIALLFWIKEYIFSAEITIRKTKLYYPILGYLSISLIGVFWLTDYFNFLSYNISYLIYALIFFLIFNVFKNQKDIDRLINLLIFGALVISVVGLLQYIDSSLIPIYDITNGGAGFGNKNMAAQYVLILLPLVLYKFINSNNRFFNILFFIVFSIISMYFLKVNAMQIFFSSVLMFIAFLALFLKVYKNNLAELKRKFVIKISIVFLSLIIAIFVNSLWGIKTNSDIAKESIELLTISPDKTSGGRYEMWLNSLEMFKDAPFFGFGTGQFFSEYEPYSNRVKTDTLWNYTQRADHPHNEFIKIIVENGATGVLFAIVFLLMLFVKSIKHIFSVNTNSKSLLIALLISLVGFLSLSNFTRFSAAFSSPFIGFTILGLIASITTGSDIKKSQIYKNKTKFLSILVIPVILASNFFIYQWAVQDFYMRDNKIFLDKDKYMKNFLTYQPIIRDPGAALNHGIFLLNNKKYDEAEKMLLDATTLQPKNTELWRQLGNVYSFKNNPKKILETFEKILTLDPDQYMILRAITQLMIVLKEPKHAKHYYLLLKKSIKKVIDDPFHKNKIEYEEIVKVALSLKDYDYAIETYKFFLNNIPNSRTPHRLATLGVMLYNIDKNYKESKELIDEALAKDSEIVKDIPEAIFTNLYNESNNK